MNFKQHLRLLKRKTNWDVAGNVGYCPNLSLSAIRHLQPPPLYSLNRSYTKPTDASSITPNAPDS